MYGQIIVIPKTLQAETLQRIHKGHQGIVRSCLRTKTSVWCLGLFKQLTSCMKLCPECARDAKQFREPLIPISLPTYPWQKIAADLFHLDGKEYLVVFDYFCHFREVKKIKSTTTQSVVNTLKMIFA